MTFKDGHLEWLLGQCVLINIYSVVKIALAKTASSISRAV